MSTLSTSIYGSSTNKGIGGLMSGLDTDDLVNQMTARTRNRINREYQAKQSLLYRQEAYREISTKLLSFSNKYFSYSTGSKTNILSPNFFKSNTIEPSSKYVNVTGDAENIKNFSIDSIESVATYASLTSTNNVSSKAYTSGNVKDYISPLAGETFSISFNGTTHNLTIPKDFEGTTPEEVVDVLNEQLATIEGNDSNAKLEYTYTDNKLELVIKNKTEEDVAYLSAASKDFLNVLEMKVGKEYEGSSVDVIDTANLTRTAEQVLTNEDAFIKFDYNGVVKTINMSEMKDSYTYDAGGIKSFLQDKLNEIYGTGKIEVTESDGALTFKTLGLEETDLIGISGISSELSDLTGIKAGRSNRINMNMSISDPSNGLNFTGLTPVDLTPDDTEDDKFGYIISINGKELEINKDASLKDIINKINKESDVNISYSSTSDKFVVKAKESGTNSNGMAIENATGGGNLVNALFGSDSVSMENATDTVINYTLNGVSTKVTRSTANFAIDGINVELNERAADIDEPITFDVTHNTDEVVERVKQFIDDYNEIIDLIGTKTKEKPNRDYLPLTPEQQDEMEKDEIENWTTEAKKGILFGDSKMNTVLRSLRESMSSKTSVSDLTLSNIGISAARMDTSGKLVFDEEKFKEKLLQNPEEIASLFTENTTDTDAKPGIAIQIQELIKYNVGTYGTSGVLIEEAGMPDSSTSDSNYISLKMEEYDNKMEKLKKDLKKERERYWNQFTTLEKTLSNLNAQSSWLVDMMGQ
ncbi:flagellar filament capping protein FliD [Sedimentibacter sp. MB31-C6]|uniref:flagellar filament capping protein FliD n=1 Tax=Sedimentibacter sp. MB31-C6 TaxID=3109366 RepID=UPI002DDCD9D4|nr:flagellar filament capping protein FliD [Sedimentibacter sp. MB36-C1]WSI04952.1 flagellar filament capping protein FliD [Sedimentibacter sp. MB36-C1]